MSLKKEKESYMTRPVIYMLYSMLISEQWEKTLNLKKECLR